MKQEYQKILKEFKALKEFKILIVEDSAVVVDAIKTILQKVYPSAIIDTFEKEDFPSIEIFIKEKKYQFVIIGGGRTKWPPHPVAGIMASETIKVVKAHNPQVTVMFISTDQPTVEMMAKRGADISYRKDNFADLYKI